MPTNRDWLTGRIELPSAGDVALAATVSGDLHNRWELQADGTVNTGDGTVAPTGSGTSPVDAAFTGTFEAYVAGEDSYDGSFVDLTHTTGEVWLTPDGSKYADLYASADNVLLDLYAGTDGGHFLLEARAGAGQISAMLVQATPGQTGEQILVNFAGGDGVVRTRIAGDGSLQIASPDHAFHTIVVANDGTLSTTPV